MEPSPSSSPGSAHLVHRLLTRALHNLALSIAHRPKTYVAVPLALTFLSALGVLRMQFSSDMEHLFTGKGTRVDEAYKTFARYFDSAVRVDGSDDGYKFQPFRTVRVRSYAKVLVMRKSRVSGGDEEEAEGSIFDEEAYAEVVELDDFVSKLSLAGGNREAKADDMETAGSNATLKQRSPGVGKDYKALCARWNGDCVPNPAIQLNKLLPKIRANLTEFAFPILIDEEEALSGGDVIYLPGILAKPKLRRDSAAGADSDDIEAVVVSSPGVSLTYILDGSTQRKLNRAQEWEEMFEEEMAKVRSRLRHVDVFYVTASTLGREANKAAILMMPIMTYASLSLILFTLISGLMLDPIQSKPYFSLFGATNALCAIVTTFGISSAVGVEISSMMTAGGLLLLGVGFDDTFVLLAAWRNSCKRKSAPDRMAEAYSEAAVSLFITSATDAVCFFIGSLTPYPGINSFCIFAGIGIILLLVYQITFFGAIMYYMGVAECDNRDALTFRRVGVVDDETEVVRWRPWRLNYSLTGKDLSKSSEPALMIFFRDVWGRALVSPLGQVTTIAAYMVYLGLSLYWALGLQVVFERRFLTSSYTSPASAYFEKDEAYFFDWPGRPMIGIFGEVDYSNRTVQRDIELLLGEIENSRWFADSLLTESWLREFLQFVKLNSHYETMDISTEESFTKILTEKFLADNEGTSTDVVLSADGTKIVASRFIVQLSNFEEYHDFTRAMKFLWGLCDSRRDMYDMRVYHPAFKWSEQSADTLKYTVFMTVSAIIAVIFISLLLIPEPSVSLWIAVSITSVIAGVLGLMTRWDITLSVVSMIGLLIATGFSIDFTAHIAYAYSVSRELTPEGRARDALHRLGLPMLQGCLSTLIGVSFVALLDGYLQQITMRMIVLIMVVGFVHGIYFFPVLLVLVSKASILWRVTSSRLLGLEDRVSIHKSCDSPTILQNCHELQLEKGHISAADDNAMAIIGCDHEKKSIPLIHLSCEKSFFTQTLRPQLDATTMKSCCCACRFPPSSGSSPAALGSNRNSGDGVFRRLSSNNGTWESSTAELEPDAPRNNRSSMSAPTGSKHQDRILLYPTIVVVTEGHSVQQTEVQLSCIPSSELSTRAAMLAAVESSLSDLTPSSVPSSSAGSPEAVSAENPGIKL